MKVVSSIKMGEDRLEKLLKVQPQAEIVQVKDFSQKDEDAEILLLWLGR
jgi:hypothetical protein